MAIYKFPENFKWGSATSAHQIEGDNHNDWTEWEQSPARIEQLKKEGKDPANFISGKACDSYNRFNEDFDIAKQLNQNIHRFSIEWSRIEPEEGRFDENEMQHYVNVVKSLRDRGIEPMVTLWHFTNPVWFARKGGFLNVDSTKYFTRYVKYVTGHLKEKVGLWITFNEPWIYAGGSYVRGQWPPQKRNLLMGWRVRNNMIRAHILAYKEIKNIYNYYHSPADDSLLDGVNGSSPKNWHEDDTSHNVGVAIVENNVHFVGGKILKVSGIVKLFDNLINLYFWKRTLPYQDFIGLNYYTIARLLGGRTSLPNQEVAEEMSWEIYSQGIYHRLMELKKFKKPIWISENGIADRTDLKRLKFIKEHLYWIWKSIQDGADIRGYLYWSLLDNFEWARGYEPRFGLVGVDYKTLERRIRPSALEYAKICLTNQLEVD